MINLIPAETIYMIRRKNLKPHFFLYDYLEATIAVTPTNAVLWTPDRQKAREFYSEESVEQFLYDKLYSRPCEIVMIK